MKRFLRWLRFERRPPAPVEQPTPTASMPEPAADRENDDVARQVIERLSEDEALRRNLSDAAFKPILDLVTSLVPAAAARSSAQPDAAEELSQSARRLVQGLAAAVTSGDPSVVSADLLRRFLSDAEAEEALERLATSNLPGGSDDERAEALVGTVKAALKRGQV